MEYSGAKIYPRKFRFKDNCLCVEGKGQNIDYEVIFMIRYMNNGQFVAVPDPLRPGKQIRYRNPDWQGMPEIISFTDFLRWNYSVEYGQYIRERLFDRCLPIPFGVPDDAIIENVTIENGKYDRIDKYSFIMYVICDVDFNCDGVSVHQEYCVNGYFRSNGRSDFFEDISMYGGERIRCNMLLDDYLVPIMSKRAFDLIAEEMLDKYYNHISGVSCKIDGKRIAKEMGYDIQYLRLSLSGDIKSKLIFDRKDVVVYDNDDKRVTMLIPANTILVDSSLIDSDNLDNVIIHECVHAYLHHTFYFIQSLYRSMNGTEKPEFLDYFYSPTQQGCVRWMETQANSITRRIQMPVYDTTDTIINFMDNFEDELTFADYRELIDHIKVKYGVSRYSAKKRIIELGWKEVRGVYVYCTAGYVEDHEVDMSLPLNYTYTLPLRCIAQIFGESSEFAALISSNRYNYIDGHMCRNDEKYIIKEYGVPFGLTEYAKHNMSECCISFKQIYVDQTYSYTFGELNKEDLKAIVEYALNIEQKNKLRRAMEERKTDSENLREKETNNPLGEAVKFHMKRCGVTEDVLADRSGLGISTITKLRGGKKVKLETILAFSVALELERPFLIDLMNKANVQFDAGNPVHNMYITILELLPDANVFQINEFLKEEGFTPWTQERDIKQSKLVV